MLRCQVKNFIAKKISGIWDQASLAAEAPFRLDSSSVLLCCGICHPVSTDTPNYVSFLSLLWHFVWVHLPAQLAQGISLSAANVTQNEWKIVSLTRRRLSSVLTRKNKKAPAFLRKQIRLSFSFQILFQQFATFWVNHGECQKWTGLFFCKSGKPTKKNRFYEIKNLLRPGDKKSPSLYLGVQA